MVESLIISYEKRIFEFIWPEQNCTQARIGKLGSSIESLRFFMSIPIVHSLRPRILVRSQIFLERVRKLGQIYLTSFNLN